MRAYEGISHLLGYQQEQLIQYVLVDRDEDA